MQLCSRSITYPVAHWLLHSLVFHLDICRALGLKELHSQSHLEKCHRGRHLQDAVGVNNGNSCSYTPRQVKGKMFCDSDWRQDRTKLVLVLPTCFLAKQRVLCKPFYQCTHSACLPAHWKVSHRLLQPNRHLRRGDRLPGYHKGEKKCNFWVCSVELVKARNGSWLPRLICVSVL